MWKCPRCGRAFERQNQEHYCQEKPKTVQAYIAAQPEDVRLCLNDVRNAIREAIPGAEERISWSMPTYWRGHNIIHFAAHKRHVGLYAGTEAVVVFKARLTGYKTSKGAIQFPYDAPMPLQLIADIAQWCDQTGNHP